MWGWLSDIWYGPVTDRRGRTSLFNGIAVAPMDWDLADLEAAKKTLSKAGPAQIAVMTQHPAFYQPVPVPDLTKIRELTTEVQRTLRVVVVIEGDGGFTGFGRRVELCLPHDRPASIVKVSNGVINDEMTSETVQAISELERDWRNSGRRRLSNRRRWLIGLIFGGVLTALLLGIATVSLWAVSRPAGVAILVIGAIVYTSLASDLWRTKGAARRTAIEGGDQVYIRPFYREHIEGERHARRLHWRDQFTGAVIGTALGAILVVVFDKIWL